MDLHNFDFSKKIFHHPERVLALKEGRRPFPVTMEVDLTNRCNHRCAFCFYAEHLAISRAVLDTRVLLWRLEEAQRLGLRGVSFTGGGEPMLHPAYLDVVAHARGLGLDVGTITNGSAVTPANADDLVRLLTWIRVSVAGGDRESYAKIQGVDQFDRVLGNVRLLCERRDARATALDVGVRTLVTPENLHSLPALATQLAGTTSTNYLQLAPDQNTTDGGAFWNDPATQDVFSTVKRHLLPAGIRLLTTRYLIDQADLQRPTTCYAHFFMIQITAEGDVGFCKNARGAERFVIGNVYEQTLAAIWHGEATAAIESWVRPANCGLFCKHMAINSAMEDIMHPSPDMSVNFVG